MKAEPGRIYAQILDGVVHWIFTSEQLPEWNNDQLPAIDITDLKNPPQLRDLHDGGEAFRRPPVVAAALEDAKAQALVAIDAAAGAARLRYITDVPGQSAVYLLKGDEAVAFKRAGYTGAVPPFIAAEANATGLSAQSATEAILAVRAAWVGQLAPAIEGARIKGKRLAQAAADHQVLALVVADALTELGSI